MIKIKKNENNPETKEILAEAIIKISEAMDSLDKSGLNRHAISVLIQFETKLAMRDINAVLDALKRLRGWYCK